MHLNLKKKDIVENNTILLKFNIEYHKDYHREYTFLKEGDKIKISKKYIGKVISIRTVFYSECDNNISEKVEYRVVIKIYKKDSKNNFPNKILNIYNKFKENHKKDPTHILLGKKEYKKVKKYNSEFNIGLTPPIDEEMLLGCKIIKINVKNYIDFC